MGLRHHHIGKRRAQAIAMDHRQDIHARVARPSEDLDHTAFRSLLRLVPAVDLQNHHLPRLRGGINREIDRSFQGHVIHIDPAELRLTPENPHHLATATRNHLLHPHLGRHLFQFGFRETSSLAGKLRLRQHIHQHAIPIQRCAAIALLSAEAIELREVPVLVFRCRGIRIDPSKTFGRKTNRADQLFRSARLRRLFDQFITRCLPLCDFPCRRELAENIAKRRAVVRVNLQGPRHLRLVHRLISRIAHESQYRLLV